MKKFNNGKNNKGVILIEAILALGVIVIILTALVTALITASSSSSFSKEQSLATGYAQEGLEIARNDKEKDFESFLTLNGDYCLDELESSIYDDTVRVCSGNVAEKFTRIVTITNNPTNCGTTDSRFVISRVTWTDSRCEGVAECHRVELNSCFVNLNRIEGI